MPVSGFATPGAAPGELDEGEVPLVDDGEPDSLWELSEPVAEPVDAALLPLPVALESWVEEGATVATCSSANGPHVIAATVPYRFQCLVSSQRPPCPDQSPSSPGMIFHPSHPQSTKLRQYYNIPRRRRQTSNRR